jgi:hypothetical protein
MKRETKSYTEYTYTLSEDEVRAALIDAVQNSTWNEDGCTGSAHRSSRIVYHDDGSVSVISQIEVGVDGPRTKET